MNKSFMDRLVLKRLDPLFNKTMMTMKKTALITGITGQDGSYLAEFLLEKNEYQHVIGLVRRTSNTNVKRIEHILDKISLLEFDMCDVMSCKIVLDKFRDSDSIEIYNLAAQSHVHTSFSQPYYTFQVNTLGVLGWLEAIRTSGFSEKIKFYQAGTSEMFGKVCEVPQNENTPFYPRSPYGVSKVSAYWISKNYRESYNLFVCNGILFNHESERRGEEFVTRKITIASGKNSPVKLGNLDAKRDWGHASDYVRGMWLMLQQSNPDDYVLATGETHSIREFIEKVEEISGKKLKVEISDELFRPSEVDLLIGDFSKAREKLRWSPTIDFHHLVELMVSSDRVDDSPISSPVQS